MQEEPIMDVAHLGHLELLTPTPEKSLDFFVNVLGMTKSGRQGESVYLRGWDDYERYSLKLTGPGLRASGTPRSARAAHRRCNAGWQRWRRRAWPSGGTRASWATARPSSSAIRTGICWKSTIETEWYQAPEALRPALKNQAQRLPARGVNVRRIDHFNCLAADIQANREFFQSTLGFRLTEQIVLDDGTEVGMWLTATNKSYDFAYTREAHGVKGRFHHVTFALDSREAILQAADVFLENGVFIETGPHKHAVQQTFFLYVYEPGGNRVEVANAGARLVLAPDWKPITWTETERKKGQAWGLKTIDSFHTHGTPPLPEAGHAVADDLADEGSHHEWSKNRARRERAFGGFRVARRRGDRAAYREGVRGHRDLPLLW